MGQKCCCCCQDVEDSSMQKKLVSHKGNVLDFVVALFPYRANEANELSFDKGDEMEVVAKETEDWWRARHKGHKEVGYIRAKYVAVTSSLESHEWYHGEMGRVEAEQILNSDLNSLGAFLLRKSSRNNTFVLSVKTYAQNHVNTRIKHYSIKMTPENFYSLSDQVFLTLSDLVEYFLTSNDSGLPANTRKYPCVMPAPTMQDITWEAKDLWELPREELKFVQKIGQGSFGEVWMGKWNGAIDVAIKTMKEGRMSAKEFLDEARVMKSLRHPNILALYAVCTKEKPLLIVTEFMKHGALLDILRREEHGLSIQLQLYIASQVAAGMAYLESKELIHRDLAARNILVGECYQCKVADFGLSKLYEDAIYDDKKQSKSRLPVKWTAPEAILHQKYSSKSDVWSFGILLMEIVTNGAIPYPGYTNSDLPAAISRGYRMAQPPNCPPKLYNLMLSCWHINPMQRHTFEFIHDYLENFHVQSESSYYGEEQR